MAKIVISNAIANIAELKSRLRGVKTPGKRILAAAFKNNDYSALIGELLTRIELYQSVGVLDYKTKDVDTIQGMKFKFGFESVLASTLKASGVSSSPRVVQQIVRQQQVMAPPVRQNIQNSSTILSSKAEYYQELIETATEVGALDGADADMWHIQPIKVKNSIASLISDALGKLEATGDFETVADDFGYERDIDFYLGFDPGVAILGCIVDATSGVNTGQSDADMMIDEWTTVISKEDANVQKTWAQLVSLIPAEGIFAIVSQAIDFAMDASEPSDALYDGASDLMNTDGFTPSLRIKGNTIDNIYLCLHAIYLNVME